MQSEQALEGGNTSVVVHVGDTVRRPVGRWTPAVHDLLNHLATVGFTGSPRVLGVDEQDREILQFVEGEVGTLSSQKPLPAWFRGEEACWTIGCWIREFQEAQVGFVLDPSKPWRRAEGTPLAQGQVIVHHDASAYNTVRRADGSIVVLDWDFARPGDPIEDLAWAAWLWSSLRVGTWWYAEYGLTEDEDVTVRQRSNLRALLDGYRPSQDQRNRLADAIGEQMAGHADDLEDMARTDPAFADLIARDYAAAARNDARWWATAPIPVER